MTNTHPDLKQLSYRWFDPVNGVFDRPAIELTVFYDPKIQTDPAHLQMQLNTALQLMIQALDEEHDDYTARTAHDR